MDKENNNNKTFRRLFQQSPAETLPDTFTKKIMQQVYRIQKRKERRNLFIVTITSLIMLAAGAYTIYHFFLADTLAVSDSTTKPENFQFPGLSLYLLIGIIVAILLWLDHKLRKRLRQQ